MAHPSRSLSNNFLYWFKAARSAPRARPGPRPGLRSCLRPAPARPTPAPSTFESLDHIFHTLFDDFCDADEPERFLGISLRTEEEVTLMRELGVALNAAAAQAPNDTDEEHLQSTHWPEVVAVAGRLARVMVSNDLAELVALHECEAWDQPPSQASSEEAH
ncbi:SCO4402 family protein [Streptomyces lydicus]|uniref:SCO4402 family protein n=1 Tax=Streptomyces lydicus TaxID=47763 RepID=UPI00378B9460